jgi:rod shape-determining protein MreC
VGFFLGKLQNNYRNLGMADPVSNLIQSTFNYPVKLVNHTFWNIEDFFCGVFSASSLTQENQRLRKSLELTKQQLAELKQLRKEVDQLRALLPIKSRYGSQKLVPAEVIAYFPYENRVTLSAGSDLGVQPGNAVIDSKGLLGVVQIVDTHRSQVNLVTSSVQKVGAKIQKDPPPIGLLKGESANSMVFECPDDKLPIEINDQVFTSGYSEKIPGGIPIGTVFEVENNPNFGVRRVRVYPHARLGNIRTVFVIK